MKFLIFCILSILISWHTHAQPSFAAGEWMKAPAPPIGRAERISLKKVSLLRLPFEVVYTGYRNYLSSLDGSHCPMKPSCSQYAIQAIRKHGLLPGLAMGADRLTRCGLHPQYFERDSATGRLLDKP